jgi:hypothetical protein
VYDPTAYEEYEALPRDILLFPPTLRGRAEQIVGAGLTAERMAQLDIQALVAPDAQSPTGDSWICLRNRAEADRLMQRAIDAVNRKRPGAGKLGNG